MITETWKRIDGFALYEISDLGRVKSKKREYSRVNHKDGRINSVKISEKILSGYVRTYRGKISKLCVSLRRNNETHVRPVHQLVLEAFVGPRPKDMECCHYDGDPLNNVLANLRWDTHAANVADCVRHGRKSNPPIHYGEKHPRATISDASVRKIRETEIKHGTAAKLARQYGVAHITIKRILDGESRKYA